jgi:ABC-2 type transport system ATP-binding protein
LILARAIIHKPVLLFLDEPTSGLDPTTANEIHAMLYELKNNGTTIFLTTHNMEEASKLCDNIVLLNSGNIVESGKPADICIKHNVDNTIIICFDDETLKIPNCSESADVIFDCFKRRKIISIHSTEPNLGDVFIKVTGRSLE